MAQEKGKKLKPDHLVEQLVPDPSAIPDVRVLIGFLGESGRDGHWRLYTNPSLNEYLEIPKDDVVHCQTLEKDEARLGGSVIWIKRDSNVQQVRATSREAQSDFLQGAIASRATRHRLAPGILNAFGILRPGGGGFQPGSVAVHASCVREFCDFVAVSWLGGGDVYCTGSFQCDSSWQAECP